MMNSARAKAWETRRLNYGPRGHGGSYSRGPRSPDRTGALAIKMLVRLHEEGTLSEGQCCKALDLDRVEWRAICDAEHQRPKP